MPVCLNVALKKKTRISKRFNHTSTYACYIRLLVIGIKVSKICRPHCNVAALRGTDESCHFHCTVLAVLCGADV